MSAFNLKTTMEGISALLVTAALVPNNYDFPIEDVTTPCSIVGYPESIEFDATFGRGSDRAVLPVWIVVGVTGTSDARDTLSAILADSSSVKSTLDVTAQSWAQTVRVSDAEVAPIDIAGTTYIGLKFLVEVYS